MVFSPVDPQGREPRRRRFRAVPVLVLLPNMDGISFVREMKKNAAYKFVPVIMLTTEGSDEKKKAGQEAGAKAWVVKPFQPQQLLAAVGKLLM